MRIPPSRAVDRTTGRTAGRARSRAGRATRAATAIACVTVVLTGVGAAADAAPQLPAQPPLAARLAGAVSFDAVAQHLRALQRIADQHGGNRAAGTPGFDASVDYVAGRLRGAGFDVSTPSFTFRTDVVDAAGMDVAGKKVEITPMQFSPSTPAGGVTGPLAVVPGDGCAAAGYAGVRLAGAVALIRRGTCSFAQKQQVAADAGAVVAVIANNVPGPFGGTLGDANAGRIPTGAITQADGDALLGSGGARTTVDLRVHAENRTARNVIAQTRSGRADNVVMTGAHLDSVEKGPGINDNGSGSATLLEIALRLGGKPKVNNAVRFAWWGAEEEGLLGSQAYVSALPDPERKKLALYLNFDMLGSPNPAYFVYDGDDSDHRGSGPGPAGSAQIEAAFVDYLSNRRRVPVESTDFDGRSDYGPFMAVGIPSGGLFTGAEEIKTQAQVAKWGGKAGVAFDPCYHQACDTIRNIDRTALDRNADTVAWVLGTFATSTEPVNGVRPG